MISYEPFWNTMREKGITQYRLLQCGINNKTLFKLKRNRNVTVLTIEKLCLIMDCTPNDILTFVDMDKK